MTADRLFAQAIQFLQTGKISEAEKNFREIIFLKPDHAFAHGNLGFILQQKGRYEEAIDQYNQVIKLVPNSFEALNNLGACSNHLKRHHDALNYYREAVKIQPRNHLAINNLATTLKNLGQLKEAVEYYREALAIVPDPMIYSNLLMAMVYAPFIMPDEIYNTAKDFGIKITNSLRRDRPFKNEKKYDRKLKIGYVSPDFRDHPVCYFISYLLEKHNRQQFEVYAYSNTVEEDAVTARIKKKVNHWRDIRRLSDNQASDLIERDQIDILVDLAGHTAHNRLMVFARKPAPIQATWLGYPATTGMTAMDYRITDTYADPVGMTENLNTEILWRLPKIFCCYQPNERKVQFIDHPPFEDNGYITFGCFNNFIKVGDEVLMAWAKIMEEVPESRLLLEIKEIHDEKIKIEVENRLRRCGLPIERVMLEPRKPSNQFVLYNRIDMALDPFPCTGGTTSMDTLWMGVPFVTLAGESFTERMGVTILTNAGLAELITFTLDEYIDTAVRMANDTPGLKRLRHNLRDKVAASPIMNQQLFTDNIETAYREMWGRYVS